MNDAVLSQFRSMHAAMHPEPHDWQWIGPHMSQRMFGLTAERAKAYAARHGGTARQMEPPTISIILPPRGGLVPDSSGNPRESVGGT